MLVKMKRADDGHTVDVHPTMLADYMAGGYRIIEDASEQALRKTEAEAQTETKAETPVKRRGRPRKAD